MVQAADQRNADDASNALDRMSFGSVFAQCEVSPDLVIIAGICVEDPAQMALAADDDVVQTFTAD